MPTIQEISVTLRDEPGTLANLCRGLASRSVNILAIHSTPESGQTHLRMIVDNPSAAQSLLSSQNMNYTENMVVQAPIVNRPGELARAATRLAEAGININHIYSGINPETNMPCLFLGVTQTGRAADILDQKTATSTAAAKAARV